MALASEVQKVWSMVRKISGKHPSGKICHLHADGSEVTDIPDIANTLAQTWLRLSLITLPLNNIAPNSNHSNTKRKKTTFKLQIKKPGNLQ